MTKSNRTALHYALFTILVCFSVYFSVFEKGLISTLPVIVFIFMAAEALVDSILKTAAASAFFAALFAATLMDSRKEMLVFFLSVVLVSLLSSVAMRLMLRALRRPGNRRAVLGSAAALTVAALLFYALVWGTPWGSAKAKKEAQAHLSAAYPAETFVSLKAVRTHLRGGFDTYFGFYDGSLLKTARYHGGADTYRAYAFRRLTERRVSELIAVLRASLPDAQFGVRCIEHSAELPGEDLFRGFSLKGAGDSGQIDPYLCFDIGIYDENSSRSGFADTASRYFSLIRDAGFVFSRITLYGGEKQSFQYQVSVSADTAPEEIWLLTKDFDKSSYVSFE